MNTCAKVAPNVARHTVCKFVVCNPLSPLHPDLFLNRYRLALVFGGSTTLLLPVQSPCSSFLRFFETLHPVPEQLLFAHRRHPLCLFLYIVVYTCWRDRVADPVLLSCKMLAYYTETRALDALHRADDREVRAGMDEYWGEECTVKGVVTVFGAKALSRPRLCATVSKDEWVKDMEHCAQNLRQTGYTNGHAVCLRGKYISAIQLRPFNPVCIMLLVLFEPFVSLCEARFITTGIVAHPYFFCVAT